MALRHAHSEEGERVECVMVADSYLTTHLGLKSTRLSTEAEQELYFRVVLDLVVDVRKALERYFPEKDRPYLIADVPDGATTPTDRGIRNVHALVDHGADAVKLEMGSQASWTFLETLSEAGVPALAHLGYTPQYGGTKRRGRGFLDAMSLIRSARRARDSGALAIILECVSTELNAVISGQHPSGIPVFSIFSGQAPNGGQCLNVWDSVFKPPFSSRVFPPTARFARHDFPRVYSVGKVATHLAELLNLVWTGRYPPDAPHSMTEEEVQSIRQVTVW